jgi:subtilisin family serine protease
MMNKCTLLLGVVACCASISGIAAPRVTADEFVPGEVIVKFKSSSNVVMRANAKGRFASSGVKTLDAKLAALGVTASDQLMPLTGKTVAPRKLRAINGTEFSDVELSTLYVLRFDENDYAKTNELVSQLKDLDEVEYAEPNYIVHTCAVGTPTDPLYSEQWGIPAIKLDQLWQQKTISDRMTIAILDTGVDIDHPDLKDNIWSNYNEVHGADDADDDGNGFVDDLHGWDFINQTGIIADYNGHGTHCAGIAAASGNDVGIIGANPDAWILPVTVMQSNGTGDVATIIKGIDYAASMGADVISMSFGTYSNSTALEQALGKAYSKSVLVAAAGNDYICIYPHKCPINNQIGATQFPAGYTFVLGVQASDATGDLASFSNYDEDGPTYSSFGESELYNYEMMAPGTSVISTYPGGQYKTLSGTSMACPLVAGAISRLMQCKSYGNKETLFADIIHASGSGVFDALATYNISDADRVPTLNLVGYTIDDTESGDGDLRADAGETLAIYPTLKNLWGLANNVKIWLTMGENEDASLVEFLDDKVDFVSLNSYAKAKAVNPLRIKIADKIVDGCIIKLQIHATCDNISAELVQDIELTVENGVELGGIIDHDMTLEPDVHYIVTSNLGIPSGVTLTIKPGTVLKFKDNTGISIADGGYLSAVGEPGKMITFIPADGSIGYFNGITGGGYTKESDNNGEYFETVPDGFKFGYKKIYNGNFSYTKLTGFSTSNYLFCGINVANCILSTNECYSFIYKGASYRNIFTQNYSYKFLEKMEGDYGYSSVGADITLKTGDYCNFISNKLSALGPGSIDYIEKGEASNNNIFNNYYGDSKYNLYYDSSTPEVITPENPSYWGSAVESTVREGIWDTCNPFSAVGFAKFDLSNMLTRPSAEAHGCVWKVVVNGYDAQDEFEQLPPLGVGRHKFEVYFNRPMNTAVAPTITMGVRAPYTQTTIGEDGTWNEAGDVYTAYVTLHGKADIDGTNRIYVYGAEDDEYFEIPEEQDRFNVVVQAAGSMSAGFEAEAGLGKVALKWESPKDEVEDLLGYNMYRYTVDADGNESEAVRVNTRLLDTEEYTDYDVVPGTTYCYYYKVMSTSLDENSPSKVVSATPLTASKGDANGSMDVTVADVVTEVNYMLGQNPQPFIFEAADVNSDSNIDVLDVVGTVNIITNPNSTSSTSLSSVATYTVKDGVLYVDSPVDLGGVQVMLAANNTTKFEALDALSGFEQVGSWQNDNTEYLFLAFSLTGKTISAGENALLNIGDASVEKIVFADASGKDVPGIDGSKSGVGSVLGMQMRLPYPNPFDAQLTVPYVINGSSEQAVRIELVDLSGRTVANYRATNTFGEYSHTFATDALARGMYFVNLYVNGTLMQTAKVIK